MISKDINDVWIHTKEVRCLTYLQGVYQEMTPKASGESR